MNHGKTVAPKTPLYNFVSNSTELTGMLRRFDRLVSETLRGTGRHFKVFTDGRNKLAFELEDLSLPIQRASLAQLFRGERLQRMLKRAENYGFVFLRKEEEPGFMDIALGHSFKFNIPGLDLKVEQNVDFLQDTGELLQNNGTRSPGQFLLPFFR